MTKDKLMRTTPEIITHLEPNEIMVFGSNLAGRHGKGAARDALKFGARYGNGSGLSGQTYAIPTKGWRLEVLELGVIRLYVKLFLEWAEITKDKTYLVTPIGCGLAGYEPSEIGPLFKGSPPNVILPKRFLPYV